MRNEYGEPIVVRSPLRARVFTLTLACDLDPAMMPLDHRVREEQALSAARAPFTLR